MHRLLLAITLTLAGCAADSTGPATEGSPSAELAARHAAIADKAQRVEQAGTALLSAVDDSRRKVVEGRSTQEVEVAHLRALMAEVERLDAELQTEVAQLEADVLAAGFPAPEPAP